MLKKFPYQKIIFFLAAAFCLSPYSSSGLALFLGICIGITMTNPYLSQTKFATPRLLVYSVIGLGAAMDLKVVTKVGLHGIGYTAAGIFFTSLLGFVLYKILKTPTQSSALIVVGTAICGGSAIAAMGPVIHAKDEEMSVSLATVFTLNAVALFVFPYLGHVFSLTQAQFGLWGALAIHDTSSVVGATMQYGQKALEIGTTVKLARALWIVPLVFATAFVLKKRNQSETSSAKIKVPWFIFGFLALAALVTFWPQMRPGGIFVADFARKLLVLTLFLIGCGLSRKTLKSVGVRPLLLGFVLWLIVGSLTLFVIKNNLIS